MEREVDSILKVNDLFCGAGGMGLGFKYAGFRLAGAWDFDKWAVESYGHNVSPKVKLSDITNMTFDELPYADVWTFGFPCQDISVAGKQAGMIKNETRSGLFYEVMRLLDETRTNKPTNLPKIILAENVKAVSKYLAEIEREYELAGYKMYSIMYNSKFWGVPQNRERYFIVGVRDDLSSMFKFPKQDESYVPKLSSVLEDEVPDKYFVSSEKAKAIIEQALKRIDKLDQVHATITPDRVNKRQNGRRAKENEQEMFTLTSQDLHGIIQLANCNPSGRGMNGNVYFEEGISPTLTTNKGEGIKVMVTGGYSQKRGFHPSDVSNTSDASYYKGLGCNQTRAAVMELAPEYRVRKLTPREYARLQGFPKSFEFTVSDSQLYKQFGNAVTVGVAYAIASSIKDFLLGVGAGK